VLIEDPKVLIDIPEVLIESEKVLVDLPKARAGTDNPALHSKTPVPFHRHGGF
jgi:hypothetical protein